MRLSSLILPLVSLSLAATVSAVPSATKNGPEALDKPTGSTSAEPHLSLRNHMTNAERIKQGLPINPPPRRRSPLVPRQATPSPAISGRLFIMPSDTTLSGYFSSGLDAQGRYTITKDPAQAQTVTYYDHRLIPQNGGSGFPFIGGTFGESYQTPPGANAFEGNSYNFAAITGTSDTPFGSPAQSGRTSYVPGPANAIEAAIFRFDYQNNEILPTWINPDGTPRPSNFGISGAAGSPIFISMNIGAFNAVYGGYSARIFLV